MSVNLSLCNISFGARIASIPEIKSIAVKETTLCRAKLRGYTAFVNGDVFMPSGKISKHDLLFKDDELIAIDEFNPDILNSVVKFIHLKNQTVVTSFLGEHIHGGYGVSFHDSNEQEIRSLLKKLHENGVGGVIATTLPDKLEKISKQIKVLNRIINNPQEGETRIFGIHLEGPFINPKKSGIHSSQNFVFPTIENFLKLEPENVSIVTLAPEFDENYALTKYLLNNGIIPSAGHSVASAADILQSGIKRVTHLFNAMAPFHHRQPTIANEGLLNPAVPAELIFDKSHIDPQVMNMVINLKPSDKLVFVSDALPQAGIRKDFMLNDKLIHVDKDMVAKDEKGTLAGGMKFLNDFVKDFLTITGLEFSDFVRYASVNPAKDINLEDKFTMQIGKKPIFTIWDNLELKPQKTFVNGD